MIPDRIVIAMGGLTVGVSVLAAADGYYWGLPPGVLTVVAMWMWLRPKSRLRANREAE